MTQGLNQVNIMAEAKHGGDWYADLVRSRVKQYVDTWPEDWKTAMTPKNKTYVAIMCISGHTFDPEQEQLLVDPSDLKP